MRGEKLDMHNVFDLVLGALLHGYVRLSDSFRWDLDWWNKCLGHCNGIQIQEDDREIVQLMIFVEIDGWQLCSELGTYDGIFCEVEDLGGNYDTSCL